MAFVRNDDDAHQIDAKCVLPNPRIKNVSDYPIKIFTNYDFFSKKKWLLLVIVTTVRYEFLSLQDSWFKRSPNRMSSEPLPIGVGIRPPGLH